MQNKLLSLSFFLLLQGYFNAVFAEPQQIPISEIKKSLACLCDCNMTVEACQGSMACDSAEKLTSEAASYLEQGLNKQAVLSAFIKKYGERILAAPTKKGFNLVAWILPFAAIILAGLGITIVLRRWVRQQQGLNVNPESKASAVEDKKSPYEIKLDEALRYLD